MSKIALITGITGQDGSYLAELLLEKGYKVYGLVRRTSSPITWRIDHIMHKIHLIEGDLTDPASLNKAIKETNPDEVYNLAAQSFVGVSWKIPVQTSEVTAIGTAHLLEAIRIHAPHARVYQASTSELFGKNNANGGKQSEKTAFMPRSPYAIAKLYAYWMVVNYRESYGMYCCNGILFNHESPRRGIEFVTRKITDGVARIKLGQQKELLLGNLDAYRDWGYAGDYVEMMWLMLQQDQADDFVIATGETHSVRDFVKAAFKAAGISDWEKYVKQDPRFMRPADVEHLHGDITKAKKELGWEPKMSFEELVKMMVESDIERVQKEVDSTVPLREEFEELKKRVEQLEKN